MNIKKEDLLFEEFKNQINQTKKNSIKEDFESSKFTYRFVSILIIVIILMSILYSFGYLNAWLESLYVSLIILSAGLTGVFYFDSKGYDNNIKGNELKELERIVSQNYKYNINTLNFLIDISDRTLSDMNQKREKQYSGLKVIFGVTSFFISIILPIFFQQTNLDQSKYIYRLLLSLFIVYIIYCGLFYLLKILIEPIIFKDEFLYKEYVEYLYELRDNYFISLCAINPQ